METLCTKLPVDVSKTIDHFHKNKSSKSKHFFLGDCRICDDIGYYSQNGNSVQ